MAFRGVSIHAPAWGATRSSALNDCWPVRFNPRPRVGGDAGTSWRSPKCCSFNPRPRVGGDVGLVGQLIHHLAFQSTPPRGGRLCGDFNSVFYPDVSIHAPAWGATVLVASTAGSATVSIHAPAWGATLRGRRQSGPIPVSIHAPAWGATTCEYLRFYERDEFQSTPPRGGRRHGYSFSREYSGVSIHAPAWGATGGDLTGTYYINVSIHAPAWGATITITFGAVSKDLFQSTPPRGGRRRHATGFWSSSTGFNPRPRVGGDSFPRL